MTACRYTAAGCRPAFSSASISPCRMALPFCTRRLWPRPMMRPPYTRTDPIGMPPSRSPASASAIAASMNSSGTALPRSDDDQRDAAGDQHAAHRWMHALAVGGLHADRQRPGREAVTLAMRDGDEERGEAQNQKNDSDD